MVFTSAMSSLSLETLFFCSLHADSTDDAFAWASAAVVWVCCNCCCACWACCWAACRAASRDCISRRNCSICCCCAASASFRACTSAAVTVVRATGLFDFGLAAVCATSVEAISGTTHHLRANFIVLLLPPPNRSERVNFFLLISFGCLIAAFRREKVELVRRNPAERRTLESKPAFTGYSGFIRAVLRSRYKAINLW